MHQEAEKVCVFELVRVMKETKDPFLNFIYVSGPLERILWDNVVLIGDVVTPQHLTLYEAQTCQFWMQ